MLYDVLHVTEGWGALQVLELSITVLYCVDYFHLQGDLGSDQLPLTAPGAISERRERRQAPGGSTPMVASPQQVVATLLIVLGAGFLFANLRLTFQLLRFLRLRSSALLTWSSGNRRIPDC